MSQRVFVCSCGWRGLAVTGGRRVAGTPPVCPTCGPEGGALAVHSEKHPQITIACVVDGQWFLGHRGSKYCPEHRSAALAAAARRGVDSVRRYTWTPERDELLRREYDGKTKGRARAIAKRIGWPVWQIKRRAAELGLTYSADRREFTRAEEAFLVEWTGRRTSGWIAKKLNRSTTSVVVKQKRMRLQRRVQGEGFTLKQLCEAFGTDHHVVERWIREGRLRAGKRSGDQSASRGHVWEIAELDVLRFVVEHPTVFRLDKVDQVWFMDLITAHGLARASLRSLREAATT